MQLSLELLYLPDTKQVERALLESAVTPFKRPLRRHMENIR
jgi:hypothetical protein